jgi:hypothetical protein
MKLPLALVLTTSILLLSGCESTSEPKLGVAEKKWLRDTVLSDLVYTEGSVKAYRSNRQYYYFQNGILVKIDSTRIPAQKIEDLNRAPQMSAPVDVYGELKKLDELRKEGIITDEEFQTQKKKILAQGK